MNRSDWLANDSPSQTCELQKTLSARAHLLNIGTRGDKLQCNSNTIYLCNDCATGWTIQGSNPCTSKRFFSSSKRPDRLWGPPNLLLNQYRGFFLMAKRQEREDNYSHPPSAEVEYEWGYTSTSPHMPSWTRKILTFLPFKTRQIPRQHLDHATIESFQILLHS